MIIVTSKKAEVYLNSVNDDGDIEVLRCPGRFLKWYTLDMNFRCPQWCVVGFQMCLCVSSKVCGVGGSLIWSEGSTMVLISRVAEADPDIVECDGIINLSICQNIFFNCFSRTPDFRVAMVVFFSCMGISASYGSV